MESKRAKLSHCAVVLGILGASFLSASLHAAPSGTSTTPILTVLRTIPLGGEGEWGYPTIDGVGRRLYLPRTNVVQVISLDGDSLFGVLRDVSKQVSHGVAIAPDEHLGFASAGKDSNVAVFDPVTLTVKRRIHSEVNPNFTLYDPASKHIVVLNHASVTVIDPSALEAKPVMIGVGSGLESAVADGRGSVFVCVENENFVARIDMKSNTVRERWSVAPGKVPAGIAMDFKTNRLFVTCHGKVAAAAGDTNGVLAVIDAHSGKVLATPPIGSGASGVAFDPTLGLAASANGKSGTLSIVKETGPSVFETIQTIHTSVSARHVACDAKTHRFFLECNLPGKGDKTFGVLVVGVATTGKTADQPKKIEIIKFEEAPKAVRASVERRFPGARVRTTERETDRGAIVFEISLTHMARDYELHVRNDGTIEATEKAIPVEQVPHTVLAALKAKYPDASIETASEVKVLKGTSENLDHYLVALRVGGKRREIAVSLDGQSVQ
jgi:DNA-binding beta-propeller fold protein YncE